MRTALLVIDAQRIYSEQGSPLFCKHADKTLENINRLISAFEKERAPIVLLRHVHKADGTDLGRMFDFTGKTNGFCYKAGTDEVKFSKELHLPDNRIEIEKNRYSSFQGTGLDEKLRRLGVERVAICGFMTNCCCESAARHAHDLDYFVDFLSDATGTPGTATMDQEKTRQAVSEFLSVGFANIYSTGDYLDQLPR